MTRKRGFTIQVKVLEFDKVIDKFDLPAKTAVSRFELVKLKLGIDTPKLKLKKQ